MSQKVFVTGISGFVGSHLAEYLLSGSAGSLEVHGTGQMPSNPNLQKIESRPDLLLHLVDMENVPALTDLLEELRPDYIFHLAARSFVGPAISDPGLTLNTNINLTLNLLEATRVAGLSDKVRILNAGSGDQYGFLEPADIPVSESAAFRPGNPYAVSKIAQEMLGYQYFRSYNMHIINTRAFNHLGPRLSAELAAGTFARQIAMAENGQIEPVIKVGNLDARRDYTDVRDIVKAYWLALNPESCRLSGCQPGEAYNICSGVDHSMREVLGHLLKMASCPLKVEPDPLRMRPSDVPVVRGSGRKFLEATGWQSVISFEQSLSDLLEYYREQVVKEA